jgi:hypothetical protein
MRSLKKAAAKISLEEARQKNSVEFEQEESRQ